MRTTEKHQRPRCKIFRFAPRTITFLDDTESLDSGSDEIDDRVEYVYNRQGEIVKMTDQNGTVHEYDYDILGCQIADRVTTVGSGVDDSVLRIDRAYNTLGQLETITSYDSATATETANIVNQVKHVYNDLGQLVTEYQEHDGPVVDVSTLKVQYAYDLTASGGLYTKSARPSSIEYPSGRKVYYNYGTTDSADDTLNRLSSLLDNDNSTHLADYTYWGVGTFASTEYPEPDLKLNHTVSGALDAFGRITDHGWVYNDTTDVVRIRHGYDRLGNRLYREDVVAGSLGTPVHIDELYSYDETNRQSPTW